MPSDEKKNAHFAKTLRGLIERENITQVKLSELLGVGRQSISLYCAGKNFPETEQLIKIAEYFNVSIDYLLTGKRPENKNIRDAFKLSEQAIENLQAVAAGKFSDISYFMDKLLSNENFYVNFRNAIGLMETSGTGVINFRRILSNEDASKFKDVLNELSNFGEYKAANNLTHFFMSFFKAQNIARCDGDIKTPS